MKREEKKKSREEVDFPRKQHSPLLTVFLFSDV